MADRLGQLLNRPVELAASPAGPAAAAVAASLRPGAVAVLENLRFSPGETSHDDAERAAFAGQLAALAGQYVGDAFGAVHRRHASVAELAGLLPHAAGYLVQAEVAALRRLTRRAERPYVVVLGGAKAAGKLAGARAPAGAGRRDPDRRGRDGYVPGRAGLAGRPVPQTAIWPWPGQSSTGRRPPGAASRPGGRDQPGRTPPTALVVASGAIPPGQMLLDIGPRAAQHYAARIAAARTVFWNGPMGVAEVPRFAAGTRAVASAMVRNRAFTVIGGGDTGAAVRASGYPAGLFSHVSTGGGASLEFLAGRELPGLVALEQGTAVASALAR